MNSPILLRLGRRIFNTAINWWVVLLGLAISQGANALVFIIIANKVPPIEYGQYLATYGLASLSIAIPNAGLDTYLLSYSPSDVSSVYLAWKRAFLWRSGLLTIWFIALRLGSVFLPPTTFPSDLIIFTSLGLSAEALIQISYSAMRNLSYHREVTGWQILTALVLIILALVWPSGAGQVTKFTKVRFLTAALFAVLISLRMYLIKPTHTAHGLISNNWTKRLCSFFVADIAMSIYLKADLTIVSFFRGAFNAGIYGAALNIVNGFFLIPNALYLFVLPVLAKEYQYDRDAFLKNGLLQLLLQFTVGAILTVILLLWSQTLIKVLLPAYIDAIPVLRLMSPLLILKTLNFGIAAILTSSQLQSLRMKAQIISALFNIIANLIVIGPLGLQGVALVYILSEFLLLIGYFWPTYTCVYRHLK